jgi:hypothetical protein
VDPLTARPEYEPLYLKETSHHQPQRQSAKYVFILVRRVHAGAPSRSFSAALASVLPLRRSHQAHPEPQSHHSYQLRHYQQLPHRLYRPRHRAPACRLHPRLSCRLQSHRLLIQFHRRETLPQSLNHRGLRYLRRPQLPRHRLRLPHLQPVPERARPFRATPPPLEPDVFALPSLTSSDSTPVWPRLRPGPVRE